MGSKIATKRESADMSRESGLDWKNYIARWAGYLGFVRVGFAKAERQADLAEMLLTREKLGLVTPFVDAPVPLRTNPKEVWPECRTVVALAYPLPLSLPAEEGEGVLARSAVGGDYHAILKRLLTVLTEHMKASGWPGQEIRHQVDTGPLVERFWAVQAGVGWIGKNQQLIVPRSGSFVALALLLLDQELPPDTSLSNLCGTCCLCQGACPSQILGREYFSAEHCLSYLTQTRALLSPQEMRLLSNRIFGCDTCQEVCPQNHLRLEQEELLRTAVQMAKAQQQERDARPLCRGVDLIETLSLTKGTFKRKFSSSAAGWRGKGILQRNALAALKNAQDDRLEHWLSEREKGGGIPAILKPYLHPSAKSNEPEP